MVASTEQAELPVSGARAGDPEAWNILFQGFQLALYTYVRELVDQEQAGLDIVQETFLSAARNIQTLRDDRKFGSWLFSIAHQKCIQHWRKSQREEEVMALYARAPVQEEEDPRDRLIRREHEVEFMGLVRQLSPAHRSVLMLHYLENFSAAEISGITRMPLGTVKSRLHYAKESLRELWETQHENAS